MAQTIESRVNNPATQLRDDLSKAERLIVTVDTVRVEDLLVLLDSIEAQFDTLTDANMDLRPERGRWESLLRRLERNPAKITGAARRAGGMKALRAQNPPAESFWWRLDELLADRRRRAFMRTAIALGGTIGILLLALWLINTLFPPDPAAVFMVGVNARLESPLMEQDWPTALAIVEDAQATLPEEAELYIWEAVIAARAGDEVRAARAADRARALIPDDEVRFWTVMADHQLRIGDVDAAEASTEEILALDAGNARSVFLQGEIAETRGDFSLAVEKFDQAYELSLEDDSQLAAMSRIRMAGALQRIGQPGPFATATP